MVGRYCHILNVNYLLKIQIWFFSDLNYEAFFEKVKVTSEEREDFEYTLLQVFNWNINTLVFYHLFYNMENYSSLALPLVVSVVVGQFHQPFMSSTSVILVMFSLKHTAQKLAVTSS